MNTQQIRMTRGQTYPMTITVRDSAGALKDLSRAFAYFGMRADIKIAPSVMLTSASITLAALQLGTLGNGLLNTVVQAKVAPGTADTIALIGDGVAKAGTIDDATANVVLHYQPGVSTVADMETLLATSAHLSVLAAGTATQVLTAASAFTAAALKLPAAGNRQGIVVLDQTASRGQLTVTLVPNDTKALVALGDSDPWIYDVWLVESDGTTTPIISASKLALYPEVTVLP